MKFQNLRLLTGFPALLLMASCSAGFKASAPGEMAPSSPNLVAGELSSSSSSPTDSSKSNRSSVGNSATGDTLSFIEIQGFTPVPNCFAEKPPILSRIFNYKQIYSSGQSQNIQLRAYVYYPANYDAGAKYPVVALFHPGGWQTGNPTNEFSQVYYWASRGAIAITFDYRLYGANGSSPTSIRDATADAISAIRWIRKFAGPLAVDPNRIIATGDSAGGHLALATALVTSVSDETGSEATLSSVPNAIFAFYPVVDLTLFYHTAAGQADPRHAEVNLQTESPMDLLSSNAGRLPLTVVWDGDAETMWLTPRGMSAAFCASVNDKTAAGRCQYYSVAGADHGFLANPSLYRSALAIMDTWLVNLGALGGNPSQSAAWVGSAAPVCNHIDGDLIKLWSQIYGYP